MNKRLVITGMGAITPLGLDVNEYWRNLLAGKSGVAQIERFDASRLPTRIAAEVKNFDDKNYIPRTVARSSSLFMRFAYAAAEEALNSAHITPEMKNGAMGITLGTALGSANELCQGGADWVESDSGKISPHLVPKSVNNMACAHLAINWGMHGPGLTINSACSAGGDALMLAAMLLLAGEADRMLIIAGESIVTPALVSSLAQAKALSRCNTEPEKASRPFDMDRDGFVIGEGGGALVLETLESAMERKAGIVAELAGWANTMDGYHITAPDPSGEQAAICMARALTRADMRPEDIDYINAHGTGTKLGDIAEAKAINQIFGSCSKKPFVSSTKGATGHLMGAGGITEIIACIKGIQEGMLPPTLNLNNPDPECALNLVGSSAKPYPIRAAMSNSLGFGGQNSSIIVKKFEKGA